jgi:hypothetical protein
MGEIKMPNTPVRAAAEGLPEIMKAPMLGYPGLTIGEVTEILDGLRRLRSMPVEERLYNLNRMRATGLPAKFCDSFARCLFAEARL